MDTSVEEQETYSLKEGDVLLTRTSETLDELGMSSVAVKNYPKATFSGFLKRLRPTQTDVVYHKFLAFYLRSPLFRKAMNNNAVMTLRCSLNEQIFSYLDLLLPEFDQQKKIGDLLFQIYAKIELNNRINAELEGMAKLLYDYWFVQFDFPMTAAQAAALGKPHLTGHPYRASGGKMIYNETLKRDIPEGWTDGRMANFCSLNSKSWGRDDYPTKVHYVDLANTKNGRINQVFTFRKEDAPSRAQRFLRAGDTIIGTVRPENCSFACVPIFEKQLTGSTGFAVLTPNTPIHREFNYIGLTSDFNIKRLSVIASGAAYPAVNPEAVAAMQMAIPPIHLIEAFHQATSASFNLVEKNERQNQELTQLRDWLLPMLMNGQVTVGTTEN
jgi:type I restriction enzyme S subunit